MSDIIWRLWIYERLRNNSAFIDLVPEESIYGAGSLEASPVSKPFVVVHIGDEFREMPGISRTIATVWAHDNAGNYNLIDSILETIRNALCGVGNSVGQVPVSGGIVCQWDRDGPDQADDGFNTLMRESQYQLIGRNGNA